MKALPFTAILTFLLGLSGYYLSIMISYEDVSGIGEAFYVGGSPTETENYVKSKSLDSVMSYGNQIAQWTLAALAGNALVLFGSRYSTKSYQLAVSAVACIFLVFSLIVFSIFLDRTQRQLLVNKNPIDSIKTMDLILWQFRTFVFGFFLTAFNCLNIVVARFIQMRGA